MEKLDRFIEFANAHRASKDIDPVYFLVKEVNRLEGAPLDIVVWRLLLYVAWYRLGSSEFVLKRYPTPTIIGEAITTLKTGTERRGMRGNNNAVCMINSFLERHGSIELYIEKIAHLYGTKGWSWIREDFEQVKFNGGWASYKWADLMKNVCGFDISAPNIGGEKSDNHSPVKSLTLLMQEFDPKIVYKECQAPELQKVFYDYCKDGGATFEGLEEMETSLCDFYNFERGRYYVGKDIDEMLEWVGELPEVWQLARYNTFLPEYLGELRGLHGVDKTKLNKG